MSSHGLCAKDLDNGRKIYFAVKDGRTIEIWSNVAYIKETFEGELDEKRITSLDFGGVHSIGIGYEFETGLLGKKNIYTIDHIEKLQDQPNKYALLTHKRNKTSIYLMPMLIGTRTFFSCTGTEDYFINAYLTEDLESLNLLYRYFNDESYNILENRLMTHSKFVKHFDTGPYHVIYQFQPEYLKEEAEKFLAGNYSQLALRLKERILSFHQYNVEHQVIKILQRSPEYKTILNNKYGIELSDDDELESRPNPKLEIWPTQ